MANNVAFITGINGMDGSHLADFLVSIGYEVHGLVRRHSVNDSVLKNLANCRDSITLHNGDMTDQSSLSRILSDVQPTEIYNLAAQSYVGSSWGIPIQTSEVNGLGVTNLLEASKKCCKTARIYQASTSEMFGLQRTDVANEETPFYPRSPYGVAKLYAHWMCVNYRESYDMFVACGILFNHESERRGIEFVTQKIANGVARIDRDPHNEVLRLGNLSAKRDWGYAKEYVVAMWKMLQQQNPEDFVIGTGECHSVEEFLNEAILVTQSYWPPSQQRTFEEIRSKVVVDDNLKRPADVEYLRADASKAKDILGWEPKVDFKELVRIMMLAQLESFED